MMRYEVFVHLDHGNPRLTFIGDTSLATDAHDGVIGVHTVDEVFERIGIDLGIGIDLSSVTVDTQTHHEADFEIIWRDTHKGLDFSKDIEI
jgi:hypothetical protein